MRNLRFMVGAALVALGAPVLAVAGASAAQASDAHVSIPSNYVYNPNTSYQRTLHDYCTKSPDQFPSPGRNADFRGPCARHDLCIMYRSTARSTCDTNLRANLKQECRYTYGRWDPRRGACNETADVYFEVVRVNTLLFN